jgi:hypothetical protein
MARIKALSPHDGKGKAFYGIIGERLAAEPQQQEHKKFYWFD